MHDIGDNSSETSEGSSIDHDAPPGGDKVIQRTGYDQDGQRAQHVLHSSHLTLKTQPRLAQPDAPDRLGSESRIPPPLKNLINEWCQAKGSQYSVNHLPCLTSIDPRTIHRSSKGRAAIWQYPNGKPLTARMFALTGTDLRQRKQKILVVEGRGDMLGPFIVSYVNGKSTSDRVSYKKWVGLAGDKNGFEEGISAIKVYTAQTQPSQGKRRGDSQQAPDGDMVVVPSDLELNILESRKRKRSSEARLDWGIPETNSNNGLGDNEVGRRRSFEKDLRTKDDKPSRSMSLTRTSQNDPVVVIPSRTADSLGHDWQTLQSPSPPSLPEFNLTRHVLEPLASSSRASWSQKIAKPKNSAALGGTTSASQIAQTTHIPSFLAPAQARSVQPMNLSNATASNPIAPGPGGTGERSEPITTRLVAKNLNSAEPLTSQAVDVGRKTMPPMVGSQRQATSPEGPQRMEARCRAIDSGVGKRTFVATNSNITPSAEVQKSGQITESASSATLPHAQSSVEDNTKAQGLARLPGKQRRKLKLEQVLVRFKSAVAQEPSRVRPFSPACDTVQKLFNQARTADVFGKIDEARVGARRLTAEFRGSERLPDEVYIINEDDELDFKVLKNAVLRRNWYTELEDRVEGGGLVDVRDGQ